MATWRILNAVTAQRDLKKNQNQNEDNKRTDQILCAVPTIRRIGAKNWLGHLLPETAQLGSMDQD